jgi:hypothetical protein
MRAPGVIRKKGAAATRLLDLASLSIFPACWASTFITTKVSRPKRKNILFIGYELKFSVLIIKKQPSPLLPLIFYAAQPISPVRYYTHLITVLPERHIEKDTIYFRQYSNSS